MSTDSQKIVVILGQTASGKSNLSLRAAQEFSAEIICADSRTIYKSMNIGTAKPSIEDQKQVKHYGLDLIDPSQTYSAAQFKDYATHAVARIRNNSKLPIIVGGSGLYIDSYVYDYSFSGQPDTTLRNTINSLTTLQLQQHAKQLGITEDNVDFANPRHLGRMIERVSAGQVPQTRNAKPAHVLLLGLDIPREQLIERITARVDTMFNDGLVEEVRGLVAEYDIEAPGLKAPGYSAVAEYIDGAISLEECKLLMIRGHKYLAKRQRTWFRRNPDIIWCSSPEEGIKKIRAFLR